MLITVWRNKMKKLTQGFCSQRASEAAVCRFHLLSHNVGVVKPFETATVIKGYANKPDLKEKDELKGPGVNVVHCIGFSFCKMMSGQLVRVAYKVYFYAEEKKHPRLRVHTLSSLFFFHQHCLFVTC